MQGKTTFILTDKDTGRVVEKREEHNMVTNAVRDIFALPRQGIISGSNFAKAVPEFLPMYKYLMHGLILFGENIPERQDDYILNGRYNRIATAGDVYAGTDAKRGTFNESQSGAIENGYRFVWDFAPEKALGSIKCAALSSIHSGNQGGAFQNNVGGILTNPIDFTNTKSERIYAVSGYPDGSRYMMNADKIVHYYYIYGSSTGAVIKKYRATDPDQIGVSSTSTLTFEKSTPTVKPTNFDHVFFNNYDRKVYFFRKYYSSGKSMVEIKSFDAETGTYGIAVENNIDMQFNSSLTNQMRCAVFNNQLYAIFSGRVRVLNLDGTFVKEMPIALSSVNDLFVYGGKLWAAGIYSVTGTPCYAVFDSDIMYLPNLSTYQSFFLTDNELLNDPYVCVRNNKYAYIMLRNDYLATINNLSEPLEKTDQHALQVRYEITN